MTRPVRPMRIKLTLEYDGTGYSGWQIQAGTDSIQARIESALQRIFGENLRVQAAGRTDAGVHALGQVASVLLPRAFGPIELKQALNALLPAEIVVREAAEVDESFDPRRAAKMRVYEYRILNRSDQSAFEYRYSWHVPQRLELGAMRKAAEIFVGEHDFRAFRTLGTELKSTVRKVYISTWTSRGDHHTYRVEASGFLRHMVRTMVATMVQVGRGRLDPAQVARLLAEGDRAHAPATAPACGLFLVEVRY